MAAGQGGNALQDMSAHSPHIISRSEQMGNATISSLNEITAPDVSRSLQTINQSIITMQEEILSLKSSQTIPGIRGLKRSRELIDTPLSDHDLNNESDQEDAIDTFWEQNATEAPEGENSENEWMDISEFFENCSDTGEELKIELASIANTVLRGKVREEKSNTLQIKHKRPKNAENLQVPRVDEILWGQLRRETKAFDYAMQKSQSMLCYALVPTLKVMQLQKDGGKIAECQELTTDIFKILAQGVVKSNEWRKEKVRQISFPCTSLCVTERLQ